MNKNLARTIVGTAFGISLLSLALIATPSIISKAYAQNSSVSAPTKVNKTGGLTATPKEATTSGSVGGYETPSMWAKTTKKKDWGPSRKTQYPGGSFVKVKKKCTKFPYCNQGDINALKLSKNESVKEAIDNISKKYGIGKNVIITILEHEFEKINKRKK